MATVTFDHVFKRYGTVTAVEDLSLTIGSAHIGTYGEKAVDVFYVTDLTGHKIEAKPRQKKIREALLEVFEPEPAEQAPQRATG